MITWMKINFMNESPNINKAHEINDKKVPCDENLTR
jgi:hypothetical protein